MVFFLIKSNTLLFVFIDVIAAWSISRSLCVLQGIYLYFLAKNGTITPLKRSRVPIISGKLHQGKTRFTSVFVLLHLGLLVSLFIGTLGVNGVTRLTFTVIRRTNVPSVSQGVYLDVPGYPAFQIDVDIRSKMRACSQSSTQEIKFWPLVFNMPAVEPYPSKNQYANVSCHRDLPSRPERIMPLLHAGCLYWNNPEDPESYEDTRLYGRLHIIRNMIVSLQAFERDEDNTTPLLRYIRFEGCIIII